MDKTKQWGLAAGAAVLAVLVGGWFLLISPQRSNATDLKAQTDTQQSANQLLQQKIAALQSQHKDLPHVQAQLAKLAVQLPDNPGLPALIRQLSNAADSAGVDLVSLTPTDPQFVKTTVSAPATASSTATDSSTAAATSTTAGAAPGAGAAAAGSASQLAYIPLQVVVNGGYFQIEQFLSNVEANKRSFLTTQIEAIPQDPAKGSDASGSAGAASTTTTAGKYSGHLQATISGRVFMNVGPAPASAPASQPAAPTATK